MLLLPLSKKLIVMAESSVPFCSVLVFDTSNYKKA